MGHVPMMLHPKAERALVVCFGTGTTAGSVLRYPDVRLDIVDINRTVLSLADNFRDFNHGAATDPRARVVIEDGRGFLLTSTDTYDVITSEPMPPTFAGVASLYSREYYELAKAHLRPGGLVVQWLPFHIVSPGQAWSILRSVQDVFPETSLWVDQGTGIIVARREGALTLDVPALSQRFAMVGAELARFGVPSLDAFLDMYTLDASAVRTLTGRAVAVTDDRPSLEYDRPRHRRGRVVGTHAEDELNSLLAVYTLRARDLPLAGVSPAEAERLAAPRVAGSHGLIGDAYLGVGLNGNAREEYNKGLALSVGPQQRGMFLFALAEVARNEGNLVEALRLLDESLALAPGNAAAVQLREALAPRPPA
jgi:spermine/spermidine synthase